MIDRYEDTAKLTSLKAFPNLRCLKLERMILNERILEGLEKLEKLSLHSCILENPLSNLDLKDLISLKSLSLFTYRSRQLKLSQIQNLRQDLHFLTLDNYKGIECFGKFFSKHTFSSLIWLQLYRDSLLFIKREWISSIQDLRYLNLSHNDLKSIDFIQWDCLQNLEYLNLEYNSIKQLRRNQFCCLKKLKCLNLSKNCLEAEKGAFDGLPGLTRFYSYVFVNKRVEKDTLIRLDNLEELSFFGCEIEYIDPESFKSTPNIRVIDFTGNVKLKLEKDTFSHLKHLERIYLEKMLKHECDEILTNLREANIDIIKVEDFD